MKSLVEKFIDEMSDKQNVIAFTSGQESIYEPEQAVEKAWGCECIIYNDNHCVKIMTLMPKAKCSVHWHANKEETFTLLEGVLLITLSIDGEEKSVRLDKKYESLTILRNVPHTFTTPDEQESLTVFMESSTPDEPLDSYRFTKSTGPGDK